MKFLSGLSLIVSTIMFYSCSTNPSPTAPPSQVNSVPLSLDGYGENLDSTYYKVWSDSSWEEFYADTTINGTVYAVIMDNTGFENIYGPNGYSGFGQYGGSVVMFDSALGSLPDTMIGGQTYSAQTTFYSQGASYLFTDQETILDTTTVATPFGTFTDCIVRQSLAALNGVVQSVTVYWLAKGPSDIARQYYNGYTILMAYGVVNGQGWGTTLSEESPGALARQHSFAFGKQNSAGLPGQSGSNKHSLAPMVLKGRVR